MSGHHTAEAIRHSCSEPEAKARWRLKFGKAKVALAKADRQRRRRRAKAKAKANATLSTVADRPLASTTVAAVAPAAAPGPPAPHQNEMREHATHQRRREGAKEAKAFAEAKPETQAKADRLDPHAATPTFAGPPATAAVADPLVTVDPPAPVGATGGMQLLADYFGSVRAILASNGGCLDEPVSWLRGRIAAILLQEAGAAMRGERPCPENDPTISVRGLCARCSNEFRDMGWT